MKLIKWIKQKLKEPSKDKIKLNSFHFSDYYKIDKANYPRKKKELMTKFLDDFFWKSFQMLRVNSVEGDYLEFGSGHLVRSFRLAYKYKVLENINLRLFAFDSFEGLPEPEGIDKHNQWKKGAMAVSIEEFRNILKSQNISQKEYRIIPGFYNKTLDGCSPSKYSIEKAAMVFVDCDLYSSTVSVLNFVKEVLTDGCIIAFDDWFCFNGDPAKGEQRAFSEFLKENRVISVSKYLSFGWHGMSFIVHCK